MTLQRFLEDNFSFMISLGFFLGIPFFYNPFGSVLEPTTFRVIYTVALLFAITWYAEVIRTRPLDEKIVALIPLIYHLYSVPLISFSALSTTTQTIAYEDIITFNVKALYIYLVLPAYRIILKRLSVRDAFMEFNK